MKRSNKILLGIATCWPIVYIVLFMVVVFSVILLGQGGGPPSGSEPLFGIGIALVMVLHLITIFGGLGLTVYYIIHAIKNEALDNNLKIMWVVLFFFFGIFSEPIYWYTQIWNEQPAGMSPGQLGAPDTSNWVRPEQQTREHEYVPPSEPPDWR